MYAEAEPIPVFRLRRYFSVAGLAGLLIILLLLIFFYRQLAFQAIEAQETRANVAVATRLIRQRWAYFASFIREVSGLPRMRLLRHPDLAVMRTELPHDLMLDSPFNDIVKLKLYARDGFTVYSTDARQIGEIESQNSGFRTAKSGGIATQMLYKNTFDGYEGVIVKRNLASVYLPVRRRAGDPVVGVMEIYSDVTPLVEQLNTVQWQIVGGVSAAFALLYLFLFVIVDRAARILRRQELLGRQQQAFVRHQAYHDNLTGLPNRASFNERLGEALSRVTRARRPLALLYFDLDRFKQVNDSLGHEVGDRLLQAVTHRIRESLRESDLLARMGGDEFTVISENLEQSHSALTIAERLLETTRDPFVIDGHSVVVGISIGIAQFPDDAQDAQRLISAADIAMYAAKGIGGNGYQFASQDASERVIERIELEARVHSALRNDEFVVYYQPRVAAGGSRMVAVEALLRWRHPERGLLQPVDFIPFLEESGLIIEVGEMVLSEACHQCVSWQRNGLPGLRVSVNLSTRQFFDDHLVSTVSRVLSDTGLDPSHLELELTEDLLVRSATQAADILQRLKGLGVKISMDDFGTGSSALQYLRRFPIDVIKIDRSFVDNLVTDKRDAILARSIIDLANNLGLSLVAEGVEDPEQAAFLIAEHCEELQGFLYSRPVPPERLADLVARGGRIDTQ